MALFGTTFTPAAKTRIAAYEAELQANASEENWLEDAPAVETILSIAKFDNKSREIGFKIGTRTVAGKHYAWCQNVRKVDGEWVDFGTFQRSKEFTSIATGESWAKQEAAKRGERYI